MLILCCGACSCCGNKAAVVLAMGQVTAPHAHPQHAYARTARRPPVASIDTLRMMAIEYYGAHTQAARHAAAAASSISHEATGVPFVVLSSPYLLFLAVFHSPRVIFQYKNRNSRFEFLQVISNPMLFGLENRLWLLAQP